MPSLSRSRNALVLVALLFALWGQAPGPVTSVHVNAQHTAAASCTFPSCFPDATNTGYAPTGVTLTAYSGPTTIVTNGTTIDSKDITSPLIICANNVTISRSYIHASANYLVDNFASEACAAGTNLIISDTKIACTTFIKGITAVSTKNFTLTRVEIVNCENGVFVDGPNVTIQDSFIHNPPCYADFVPQDPHIDSVQIAGAGTGVTVQHNTLYGTCDRNGAGDGGNSALHMHASTSIVFTQNLVGGGGYAVYCNETTASASDSWTSNRFSTSFSTLVGTFGPTAECSDESTFTSNVCYPSGTSLSGSATTCAP